MAFNYLPRAHKNRCIRTNKREGVELVSYYAFLFTLQASVQQLSHKIPMHFNEMYIHHIVYMYLCLYYPSSVFVLNHTSPDDFQPLSLREMHSELAANFQGAKVNITGKCVRSHNTIWRVFITRRTFSPISPFASIGENFIHEYFLMY